MQSWRPRGPTVPSLQIEEPGESIALLQSKSVWRPENQGSL